jgi:betaine lipid synthase
MDLAGGNILPLDLNTKALLAGIAVIVFASVGFSTLLSPPKSQDEAPGLFRSFLLFFYSCFLKPHDGDHKGTQQDALESFYANQAGAYDSTRKILLKGREDMLGLVAAQLEAKAKKEAQNGEKKTKRIWVDVGGGTGWNIEAMSAFVNVPEFFSSVYLVDFSPSLCEIARKRFARLGWSNVKVVCEDARKFRLEDYESDLSVTRAPLRSPALSYFTQTRPEHGGADLVTLSYSLSMIVGWSHRLHEFIN